MMQSLAKQAPLFDHVDVRLLTNVAKGSGDDRNAIVQLAPDHPGFSDAAYRARRNQIAHLALEHMPGARVPEAPYTPEEHEVWRSVWDALEPAHRQHACAEYLSCLKKLDLTHERIPQLQEVSETVKAISGFRLEPVAGLVEPRVFLGALADGVFLCTQYIRHHSTPLYTPEPDVVHEIIGHALTLASGPLAELNRLFGEAVKRTHSPAALERLSRVYWFTIEFGVVREAGGVHAYGTGLLSSAGELAAMCNAELRPLDLEAASHAHYDPTDFQPVLFCADSFDAMYHDLKEFLIRWP